MKHLLTVLAVGFALLSCKESIEQKNDLKEKKLHSKIKSIREISYKAVEKFGKIEKGDISVDPWNNTLSLLNEQGSLIEENSYNADGSLSSKFTSQYDAKGNEIESNRYNANGSLDRKWTSQYNAKGNKIESNSYNADGSLNSKWTYQYDAKGNQIESNWYKADGSLSSKRTSQYDAKGNEIESNSYNADGSLDSKWTCQYTYDQHGNWIKKISYLDNKPKEITERTIEYYP